MIWDVAIAGGGPAGLAFGIHAARQGLSVVVLERQRYPIDKACGEGLMPVGVRRLWQLGALERIGPADSHPFTGIRYVQEDGSAAEGQFPGGEEGLGIRRVALSKALVETAREAGVIVKEGAGVRAHRRFGDLVAVATDAEEIRAAVLVAADGLASPIRRVEGLEAPARLPRRYGLRRHFHLAPWADRVEVHFGRGVEAYVTPVGSARVGIAFLWEPGAVDLAPDSRVSFDSLLARFPALARKVAGAPPESTVRGAGPFARRVRARVRDRIALLGDAAGYVDALTGEGLSLAFQSAEALADVLPSALVQGATAEALAPYEREAERLYRPYARLTRALLAISRRPMLRRAMVHALGRAPMLFDQLLGLVA